MIDKNKACCFTGHRYISNDTKVLLCRHLEEQIPILYAEGISDFLCGGALGFDILAAEAVLKFKESLPNIKLIMTLPCINQAEKWNEISRKKYESILAKADEIIYVSENYHPDCMQKRNRFMVDNSSCCMFYLTNDRSGTAYTIKYALEKNLRLINLLY